MSQHIFVFPGELVKKDGGSYQECEIDKNGNIRRFLKYCTIKDKEKAPATSASGHQWVLLYRTPDNGRPVSSEKIRP